VYKNNQLIPNHLSVKSVVNTIKKHTFGKRNIR